MTRSAGADPGRQAEIVESFRTQARGCRGSGSPLYAELLERAAGDLEAGGPFATLVSDYTGTHPLLDALPIQVLGALHAEVLAGRAPELARCYPTAGGHFEAEPAWQAAHALVSERADALRGRLVPVQTNEVRRCCALVPALLEVERRTGLPLRLLEIGASAGLNQAIDRYGVQLGPHRVGPDPAPLVLACEWRGAAPPPGTALDVAERHGCDPRPIDLSDPEARLRLASFVWADQVERLERIQSAMEIARANPPRVERAGAAEWLPPRLAELPAGLASVVFHSVVWWYLSEDERAEVTRIVETAGLGANAECPLFWLRMEGASLEHAEVRLRQWPDGEDHLLARTHWHGAWVEWLQD